MKPFQKAILITIVTALLLCGCAARVISSSGNTSPIKKLNNAKVIWVQPPILPMKYTVLGDSSPSDETKESWKESSLKGILPLVESIKNNVPSEVESFLRKKGVTDGDEAAVIITLKEVSWTGVKPGAQLTVTTKYKNSTEVPWSMTIAAGGSVVDTADTTAKKFTSKIIDELVKLGFVSGN